VTQEVEDPRTKRGMLNLEGGSLESCLASLAVRGPGGCDLDPSSLVSLPRAPVSRWSRYSSRLPSLSEAKAMPWRWLWLIGGVRYGRLSGLLQSFDQLVVQATRHNLGRKFDV
jgi:hypothetical protein